VQLDKLARYLEDRAKRKRTVYYSELVAHFGLPSLNGTWVGHPLRRAFEALDREDAEADRPFRTSMVISKEKNIPGDGYFKALADLKGIHTKSEEQRLEAFSRELSSAMNHRWWPMTPNQSINTSTKPVEQRSIFVAYAYNLYDRRDYRKVFMSLEKAFGVKFIFADEKITNMHIMQKIISYIQASDFSIYDISGWNPNVTLELGIGMMSQKDWYILVNPEKTPTQEVPSDIKGIDRIQYTSFSDLEERLAALLSQRYSKVERQTLDQYIESLQKTVAELLGSNPGLTMADISKFLRLNLQLTQAVVGPLAYDGKIESRGIKRWTKYYLKGQAPEAA
jgi:hypothetical protein